MPITRIGNFHSYIGTYKDFKDESYEEPIVTIDEGASLWLYDTGGMYHFFDNEWRPINMVIGDGKGIPLDLLTAIQAQVTISQILSKILTDIEEIKIHLSTITDEEV
jgi:hypothetical protein